MGVNAQGGERGVSVRDRITVGSTAPTTLSLGHGGGAAGGGASRDEDTLQPGAETVQRQSTLSPHPYIPISLSVLPRFQLPGVRKS